MKFVFTGPESSGKTTLSKLAREIHGGDWVEEMAREYLAKSNQPYQYHDIAIIGKLQHDAEKKAARQNMVLWLDTDIVTLWIWSIDKFEKVDAKLKKFLQEAKGQQRFYFLCYPDLPWVNDPLRENPFDRERLFDLYHDFLEENRMNFTILRGNIEDKKKIIDQCFKKYGHLI